MKYHITRNILAACLVLVSSLSFALHKALQAASPADIHLVQIPSPAGTVTVPNKPNPYKPIINKAQNKTFNGHHHPLLLGPTDPYPYQLEPSSSHQFDLSIHAARNKHPLNDGIHHAT